MSTLEQPSVGPLSPGGPIAAPERFMELDVLRGFALFGILIANLSSFNGWWIMSQEQKAALATAGTDGLIRFLQNSLILGKFYTIFSLLFGIGFAIQLSRASENDGEIRTRFVRRLLVLIGIGLLHLCLWSGDILVLYALCGFLLFHFRNKSDRTLIAWAAALIFLPVPYYAAMWLSGSWLDPSVPFWELAHKVSLSLGIESANSDETYPALLFLLKEGGFLDQLRVSIPAAIIRYAEIIFEGRMFKVFGVFLIGLFVGRSIERGDLLDNTSRLRRVFALGMIIGLPANLLLATLLTQGGSWPYSSLGLAQAVAYAVGVVPLGLAYAAGIALLWQRPRWRLIVIALAPTGRMALTNYIGQTLIAVLIFYGVGLGLMGTMGPTSWTILAVIIFAAQMILSALWLRHFRFGPLEWVWRQLTYRRRLPLRRSK